VENGHVLLPKTHTFPSKIQNLNKADHRMAGLISKWSRTHKISQNLYRTASFKRTWTCGPAITTILASCSLKVRMTTKWTDPCSLSTPDCKEQTWTTKSTASWTMSGTVSTKVKSVYLVSLSSCTLHQRITRTPLAPCTTLFTRVHLLKRWSTSWDLKTRILLWLSELPIQAQSRDRSWRMEREWIWIHGTKNSEVMDQ
jgi:hypothetical protein